MDRPISLLLAALGGQGGGVLTAWLMEAARLAGYPAQSTSIPGVAQRTGATTYYFELFPDPNPPGRPIFSLFPSASEVDVVAALEPTEAGRALQEGYVTAATTVVTSTQRVYSVAEKVVAGDGRLPAAPVVQALAQAAGRLVQVQLPPNGQANAYFFGALIGSRALPFSPADGRGAIENLGLAVAVNLAGFEAGVAAASHQAAPAAPELPPAGQVSPIFLTEETAPVEMPAPPGFEPELAALPAALRGLVGHGLARLVDYQDAAYARRFLARLGPILAADEAHPGHRLSAEVARRLAAWMSHEDIARVAQLKTRRERLARIRQEVGARAGEPVQVTDFLSPGWEEVGGVLPAGAVHLPGPAAGSEGSGRARRSSSALAHLLALGLRRHERPGRAATAAPAHPGLCPGAGRHRDLAAGSGGSGGGGLRPRLPDGGVGRLGARLWRRAGAWPRLPGPRLRRLAAETAHRSPGRCRRRPRLSPRRPARAGSGVWPVVSGQWSVFSSQWSVVSSLR
ncbi:MAG: indolepyruvate oxidoreductase subunit beta family protein [Caldilineales bacterium]|nr:indolepyruvate oxidoreductase subunit beta family protein [Caldilineales bacterium]